MTAPRLAPDRIQDSPPLLHSLEIASGYASGGADLLRSFYLPCLGASTKYDRAAGYFRSSLFAVVGVALSDFALRGGHMRLVCSPALTLADIASIKTGVQLRERISDSLSTDLRFVLVDPRGRTVLQLLSTLIALGHLEVRLAYRADGRGIFHDKRGVFEDYLGDVITFSGSANESLAAWDPAANHESFEVFRSWGDASDRERVARHVSEFADLWEGKAPGITVAELPDVPRNEILRHAVPEGLDAATQRVRRIIDIGTNPPADSYPHRLLKPHQVTVVASWRNNNNRGIIDHVTGAGKTLSALEIVRGWLASGRPVLVLVPGDLLMDQWRAEIARELAPTLKPNILLCGAGESRRRWLPLLADMTRNDPELGPRLTLATMQTAATPYFLTRVHGGDHLLLVADEVHRLGSARHLNILAISAGGRLGLSATPQRYRDPAGTAAIEDYFGPCLFPHIGIPDAISAGMLVPYDYFVHTVALHEDERSQWRALTDQIAREFAKSHYTANVQAAEERLTMLQIRRALVLKRARAKVPCAVEVLLSSYRPPEKWLVYCEDTAQMEAVRTALAQSGITCLEYHSAMVGAPEETLSYFRSRGGVLLAIRCLDEGVDIPSVDHALILASSTNTRQFIQRRGRVLRVSEGKYSAAIHDVLVIIANDQGGYETVASEIRRALLFAKHSRNVAVRSELEQLLEFATNDIDVEIEEAS